MGDYRVQPVENITTMSYGEFKSMLLPAQGVDKIQYHIAYIIPFHSDIKKGTKIHIEIPLPEDKENYIVSWNYTEDSKKIEVYLQDGEDCYCTIPLPSKSRCIEEKL